MFIALRNHTTYSLCKGAIKIPDLIEKAKSLKMPALAIMDSQNLFGALEFSMACKKAGIQPILGSEMLVDFGLQDTKNFSNLDFENNLCKTPLIAINDEGYRNLMFLVSESYLLRKNGISPHIDFELLKQKSAGIIFLSGGVEGIIGKLLLAEQQKQIDKILPEINQFFEKRFYIEISRHGTKNEDLLEPKFIDLAQKNNIPLVATNNVYFLTKEMHEAQDILSCIYEGHTQAEENRHKNSPEQYFKNYQEFLELFADLPEAIENTINIAKRCHTMAFERPPTLPKFSNEVDFDEAKELKNQSFEGLKNRLKQKFKIEETPQDEQLKIEKIYFERLEYELAIIIKMNFSGYFLIVSDFIKWSKNNEIPVGPGRGSGAGSIVAWALQITDLDPIRFGLLFERFLNPDRVSMPDFDIDFCQSRRDEVIDYVQKKYGTDYVAQIITFGKLQARAVLKDVGRVLQMPYSQVDRICKLIPFNAIEAVTLEKAIEMDKDLQQAIKDDPQVNKLVDIGLKLEGLNRHASTHAAGVVIGNKPLREICALYNDEGSTMPAVGYSMKYAESAGLVKFDFLGLKTLTTILETVKLIEKNRGIKIDIANLRLDDKTTFEMLASGDSIGVFQIESSGMRSVLRQMKADKIEDIIALISLYRPGPMDNIPTYIRRKHGDEKIAYPHPLLEPVLKETYGVIVYQEQVMEIAKILAGYSLGGADLLRRAMGKKIKEEMDKQREIFVSGAKNNNISEEQANEIFDLVDKFAGYGFNKSHAAAYAMISYQTAYLKAHFLPEFLTASINLEIDNTDKINIFLQVAKSHKIPVLPPDINKSHADFSIEIIQ
ncbi:MAG: DNA polymerase III subunit alpha [Proteobacteria bacterium]|nr:DNA polymerase III subunit alpha [Pseudomonadota bacterium]NCA27928.1 DNA polymerase III subunit alpha [Pseudomonadota bacterium]